MSHSTQPHLEGDPDLDPDLDPNLDPGLVPDPGPDPNHPIRCARCSTGA